jgi:hypothetical protein
MQIVARIAENVRSDSFAEAIPDLIPFFEGNPPLKPPAIAAFCSIVSHASDVPAIVWPTIARVVDRTTDPDILRQVVQTLRAASRQAPQLDLDYAKLLSGNVARETLLLILDFMPFVGQPFAAAYGLRDHECRPWAADLVPRLLPPIEDQIVAGAELALIVLAAFLSVTKLELSPRLYKALAHLAGSQDHVAAVLLVATAADPAAVVSAGVLHAIRSGPAPRDRFCQWHGKTLSAFETQMIVIDREITTLAELIDVAKDMSPFEFDATGLVPVATEVVRRDRGDLRLVRDICVHLLGFVAIPRAENIFPDREPESFATSNLRYTVICGPKKFTGVLITHVSTFLAFEAWYNETQAGLSLSVPDVSATRLEQASLSERGLLHRLYETPGYCRFGFKMEGNEYAPFDNPYYAKCRVAPNQSPYRSTTAEVELLPGAAIEQLQNNSIPRQVKFGAKTEELLALADAIHGADPSLNMACEPLERRAKEELRKTLFPIVAGFSPVARLVYDYPYLFSLDLKAAVFRLTSLDLFSAMAFAHTYLIGSSQKLLNGRPFWPATVRRDHLLGDGIRLVRELAAGTLQIDLAFDGELGFGWGPTREFFDLFAKALASKRLQMWRDDQDDGSDYAFTKIGLFPRPDADPELFHVLGLLVAKAVTMNVVLPIPLSEQFFRLVGGEPLTVRDIDVAFADSLEQREDLIAIGMPFTYPGIDDLELIPNGSNIELTDANYELYVEAVGKWTCGEGMRPVIEQFNRGFFSIIMSGMWERLSADERRALVTGEGAEVTMADLERNIVFAHGYGEKAPQRKMLLEVIFEMEPDVQAKFFRFITGCERLPVGGLAALQPRIAVAKRVTEENRKPDETLPTAATCANYFKLPPYSSKAVLRERVILAINEAQEGFLLS